MPELDDAIRLANTVLDQPSRDPDDDLSMLARQFLRAREAVEREREACAKIASDHAKFCHKEAHNGGCAELYERASGAAYIEQRIRGRS